MLGTATPYPFPYLSEIYPLQLHPLGMIGILQIQAYKIMPRTKELQEEHPCSQRVSLVRRRRTLKIIRNSLYHTNTGVNID